MTTVAFPLARQPRTGPFAALAGAARRWRPRAVDAETCACSDLRAGIERLWHEIDHAPSMPPGPLETAEAWKFLARLDQHLSRSVHPDGSSTCQASVDTVWQHLLVLDRIRAAMAGACLPPPVAVADPELSGLLHDLERATISFGLRQLARR